MNLRSQIMRGGVYLVGRQMISMVIGFAGMLILTRQLGPGPFGLSTGSMQLYNYLSLLGQCGLATYLVRSQSENIDNESHQAFSLLLVLGLTLGTVAVMAAPIWEHCSKMEGVTLIAITIFAALPLDLISAVPLARLERAMRFDQVAMVELAAQIGYQVAAISLAFLGAGAWALVAGFWAMVLAKTITLFAVTRYRPLWVWDRVLIRDMLRFGVGFSTANWIWQARMLVNPLLVGRVWGNEAVGCVSLAIRLVEIMSYAMTAGWRLAVASFARLQQDKERLTKALVEGMRLQVIVVGLMLAGTAVIAPWLLPVVGKRWEPAMALYPFLAFGALTSAMFSLQCAALSVVKRNWEVALFNLAYQLLFLAGAGFLIPRWGVAGYGWAFFIVVPSHAVVHFFMVKYVGRPRYGNTLIWFLPLALVMFTHQLGWWCLLGLVLLLLRKATWTEIREMALMFQTHMTNHLPPAPFSLDTDSKHRKLD